ncbi:UNVERIFIED_ORG: hypothetical protein LHJ69_05440 [Shinella sp. XGS7]|nr:hypothetical protein [Shinella sp. XGS7]
MIYMRIVVCVAGLVLAGLQLWQFQWALAISGVITALLALAGLVFGWEAIAESLPVQAGGALALLLGLFGTVTSSSAFNMELQEAQTAAMSASVYGAMGDYCERSASELWGKATLHCAMQSNVSVR